MTPSPETLSYAQIRRAVVTLAQCPGWTEFVLPRLQKHLGQLREKVLNGDGSEQEIMQARADRLALVRFFKGLDVTRAAAFKAMTGEESMHVPVTVVPQLVKLFHVEEAAPAAPAPTEAAPKIEFPPAHTYNPFAATADVATSVPKKRPRKKPSKPKP